MTYTQTSLATLRSKPGSLLQKLYSEFGLIKTELDALAAGGAATHKITRSATIVVAASDSSEKSKAQADYVCDGTNDDVTIQTAINSLQSGGKVQLMEGNYDIRATILIPGNTTLQGIHGCTVLTCPSAVGLEGSKVIKEQTVNTGNIVIKDIVIDGTDHAAYLIYLSDVYSSLVSNVETRNAIEHGIQINTSSVGDGSPAKYNEISSCVSHDNARTGILLGGPTRTIVTNNFVYNNGYEAPYYGGIWCDNRASKGLITNNIIHRNGHGIALLGTTDFVVAQNIITDSEASAIYTDTQFEAVPRNIIITDNYISGKTLNLSTGTNIQVSNNLGYVTNNVGSATVTASSTTVDVTHGLAATPTRVLLTPTTSTAGKQYYVSAKTATTFTITIDSEADDDITFDWQAVI